MPKVARFMDMVGTGLIQSTKPTNVFVEGKPIATLGDTVSTHGEAPHIGATIVAACAMTVFAGKSPVAMVGSKATCMHSVTMGSFTVNVGDMGSSLVISF